ncbi:MAG: hypothetical protein ACQEQV_03660 [Fibrobacterota bacterium]
MQKPVLILSALFFFLGAVTYAAEQGVTRGRAAAFESLLLSSSSAYSRSLSGIHSLSYGSPSGFALNPVNAAFLSKRTAFLSYEQYMISMNAGAFGTAFPVAPDVTAGVVLSYLNVGDINGYDETGGSTGVTYNPFSMNVSFLGASRWGERFFFGGAGKIALDYLAGSYSWDGGERGRTAAAGLLFDGGFVYRPVKTVGMTGGMRNVGVMLHDYSPAEKSPLPASFYSGISAQVQNELVSRWFLEGEYYMVGDLIFRLGLEVEFPRYLSLRGASRFDEADIRELFGAISASESVPADYSKSTTDLFSLGGGLEIPAGNSRLFMDLAVTINTDAVYPLGNVTMGVLF